MSSLSAIPRESWLRGNNHEQFALAMMRCQHAGGYCAQDGFCHFRRNGDGSCFREDTKASLARRISILERKVAALESEGDE